MPNQRTPKDAIELGVIPDPDPVLQRKVALTAAYRLHRLPLATKKREVLELLQALGIAPYQADNGARVDTGTGQTIYPPSPERKEKARVRKQQWRLGQKDSA